MLYEVKAGVKIVNTLARDYDEAIQTHVQDVHVTKKPRRFPFFTPRMKTRSKIEMGKCVVKSYLLSFELQ